MNVASRTMSGPDFIVCPACGRGELRTQGHDSAECNCCGRDVEGAILRTLEQIVALPDALGKHACECGHPEMRRLPDGVFHCPACGSEVPPLEYHPPVGNRCPRSSRGEDADETITRDDRWREAPNLTKEEKR